MPERETEPETERDRRHQARAFDAALIADFLRGRGIRSVERFSAGKSNTNYRLELGDGEVCVARLLAKPTAARESDVMRLARDQVPVPEVLAEGEDWLVLSYIEGAAMETTAEQTRAAAETLARLSAVTFPTAGWLQPDGRIEPFNFGSEGDDFVASMLANSEVRRWLDPETLTALPSLVAEQARLDAAEPELICLCHGDFNPGNLLFRDDRLVAVLDWEFAHAGSPFMDIGNLLRHTPPALHGEIAAGFQAAGRPLPEDWRARAEFLDLSSHLEFLTTARADAFKQKCAEWVRAFAARYRYQGRSTGGGSRQ